MSDKKRAFESTAADNVSNKKLKRLASFQCVVLSMTTLQAYS